MVIMHLHVYVPNPITIVCKSEKKQSHTSSMTLSISLGESDQKEEVVAEIPTTRYGRFRGTFKENRVDT